VIHFRNSKHPGQRSIITFTSQTCLKAGRKVYGRVLVDPNGEVFISPMFFDSPVRLHALTDCTKGRGRSLTRRLLRPIIVCTMSGALEKYSQRADASKKLAARGEAIIKEAGAQ
jgi:hypothetical protein